MKQMTEVLKHAYASRSRRRDFDLFTPLSLVLGVILPVVLLVGYLYLVAADQYHSRAAFSVRSEQSGAVPQGFLGAIATIGGGSTSAKDTDLLFDYIRSQSIVETVDEELNLRGIFRQRGHDSLFSLAPDASTEELLNYWRHMVTVSRESRDGIIYIESRSFSPEDAQQILIEVLTASSDLINRLSENARADSLRLSADLVDETRNRLDDLRQQLTEFRRENRLISPELEAENLSGLIGMLRGQISEVLVERDLIVGSSSESDPRIANIDRRLQSLRTQLEEEQSKLTQSDMKSNLDVYSTYEALLLDQEMLSVAYGQALANEASAHAEARRQARYVTVHVPPSLAQTPLYPKRLQIILVTAAVLLLIWSIVTIFYKNARDRH